MGPHDPLINFLGTLFILLVLLGGGIYFLYAAVSKKPLSDPSSIASFVSSVPFWPEDLTKALFILIGGSWVAVSVWYIVGLLVQFFTLGEIPIK